MSKMTYVLDIQNDVAFRIDEVRLRTAAECVLSQQAAAVDSALALVFMEDAAIARLNQQFRGIDAPTDVLSFPADAPLIEIPDEPPYLGDLVVGYPYAAAQAAREGHDLDDSLCLLVIHGILHLLGFDHDTPQARAVMWAAQAEALQALGIPLTIVPSLENAVDDEHDTQ